MTDGGIPEDAHPWEQKAHENVQKWGLQPVDALLLAMGEEMGELAGEVHGFADYPEADGEGARMAEQGRDLIRRMDALGRDIRDFLETVSERDGEPVPEDERPDYLDPFPEDLKRSRRERHIRAELDDLMALGYQFLWALEAPSEDPEVRTDGGLEASAVTYTLSDENDDVNELTPEYVQRFAARNPRVRLESATFRAMTDGTEGEIPVPEFPTPPEDVDTGERGLYGKYVVLKDGEPQDGCFVLKPGSDAAAREALAAYADATENSELETELEQWLDTLDSEDPEPVTDGGVDIPDELDPDAFAAIPDEELEQYRKRREMFTCPECSEVADARVESLGNVGQMILKPWIELHTHVLGDSQMVYIHVDEDAVDRGADLRNLAAKHAPEDGEPDPREPPEDDRPDPDAHHRQKARERRRPRTDGGEPNPRMPATLRDENMANVHETERCDGAGSDGCVREDPELTRGEDEIHVTNYGPGHSESGRRVLCGECKDKQRALNIADNPDLAGLYQDELADLRERFPDILGDVDLPVTDGGEPEDWTEQYATTTYRGPQRYPVPGAWVLGIVEGDGIGWKHYPDAGEGASHDSDVMDAMDPDEYREGPDTRASLIMDYPEGADVMEDPPYHELTVDGEVVMVLKDASEVPETEWWRAIAEALDRYDSGGEPGTVLSELGLEHLKADPFSAREDADDGEDVDRSLDEFTTDGGTEQVVVSEGANGNSKRFHRDRGDGRPDCRYGNKENLDWTDKTVAAIYAFYSPCPFCFPDGHDEYQRLTGNTEDRVMTDGGSGR